MKIGIITQILHANYGGILQAFALETVLDKMGHQAEVIERDLYNTSFIYVCHHALRKLCTNILFHRNEELFPTLKKARNKPIEGKFTHRFIHNHIRQRVVKSSAELKESNYDAYVVGSDQVWRPRYNGQLLDDSFLKFAKNWNIKRIAYAASFGTDDWEYTHKQEKEYKKLVKKFDAISVREKSGIDLCKIHFGTDAIHVLDPTMLLSPDDYIKLIMDEEKLPEHPLVTYVLDENEHTQKIVKTIAKQRNLTIVRANSHYEDKSLPVEQRIQPPVESWLQKFSQAEFIVADSFHACVFSIIFQRQFIVLSNADRGQARLQSLLSAFGIEDRLIHDIDNFDPSNLSIINYKEVNRILKSKQQESISFLKMALS